MTIRCPKLQEAKAAIQPRANLASGIIIDSGATHHMFGDKSVFDKDLRPIESTVSCANAGKMRATDVGYVNLNNDDGSVMRLQNALYVPKLNRNLLSVRGLNEDGYNVIFRHDGKVILSKLTMMSSHRHKK